MVVCHLSFVVVCRCLLFVVFCCLSFVGGPFLCPNVRYFVAIARFVAIYAVLGDFVPKKCYFFVKKQCFVGKNGTITWYI